MKFILAPDSFKGSLSSKEVGLALEEGIRRVFLDAEVVKIPMADGGEGTVEAFLMANGGQVEQCTALDPLGVRRKSFFGILGDGKTAVIEMAAVSGLPLVPFEKRNPALTTTFGTGELILNALDAGCRKIILGLGGSATNDGGVGCLQALGVQFLDIYGEELPFGGIHLEKLVTINSENLDHRLQETEILIACDVSNPLCGEYGAARIYGPQKGATLEMVVRLDAGLAHYAGIIQAHLGIDIRNIPGAGAAGGFGAGLIAFLRTKLRSGADLVSEFSGLEKQIAGSDVVITGEGKIDGQTASGKAPLAVANLAKKYHKTCFGVAGMLDGSLAGLYPEGFSAFFSIAKGPVSLDEAIKNAYSLIVDSTEQVMRIFQAGGSLNS